ncbi:hypothetical protein Kpol_1050p84 [Vanderwaltozyma polyspora DSM 70294]|uniref:Obg family GTPase CgtA n=1 Tax=Vanderwaltozyma polyspora (strain ATCC 22028 / DSM 70294 / BCRC 21397 / CBS 2163 / NBRC 10782 / NRRL Y-8283 / UCD 57-17) TaxID=436907 RepID=A7TEX8_VANPO|nr:uncharacterized protein Kpol_1050p84 [Vanderwaltozyma polyspora DSM 70294]EDO19224.1 hypothetical protein Kpol_1050p84 [Vanderwaltozyma polyspora DSM 70294]
MSVCYRGGGSLSRYSFFRRTNSGISYKFPASPPSVADNQAWLEHLYQMEHSPSHFDDVSSSRSNAFTEFINFSSEFPYQVTSIPPDSKYINVKASLNNFTNVNYLHNSKNKLQQGGFVDTRIIKCSSGQGGNGVVSFYRDAGRAIGPPDGGDGGDGGSIYVQAVEGMNSLAKLKSSYLASEGSDGAGDQLHGARGRDILIKVPVGTVIRWCLDPGVVRALLRERTPEEKELPLKSFLQSCQKEIQCVGKRKFDKVPEHIQLFRSSYKPGEGWLFKGKPDEYHNGKDWFKDLNRKVKAYDYSLGKSELNNDRFPIFGIDLDKPMNKPLCLLKGGKGGLGNMHFLTQVIRNPRFAKSGRDGLSEYFLFELKTIADLGLVGLPNAGKSTILNRISNSKPRIGHWKFTTLFPTVGTISLGIDKPSFTVADIPGIIEGASQDKGMGLEFIRHIERSTGWVMVISLEEDEPLNQLHTLINELGGPEKIKKKNILVVCNKADIAANDPNSIQKYLNIKEYCDSKGWDSIPISALNNENIDELIFKMSECAKRPNPQS